MRSLQGRASAERPAPIGLLGTAALHGCAVLAFVAAGQGSRRAPLPAYAVELIAAPRATDDAAAVSAAAPATGTPLAAATRPAAAASKRAAPARSPAPAPPATRTPAAARPPAPGAAPTGPAATAGHAAGANPSPGAASVSSPNTNAASGTGTAPAAIRTVGVEFPFEGYLRNLVAQVYRRWHPPSGNTDLESEMLFFVHRDGTITGLQFVRRSGSFAFDLEAQGAVEAAARAGAFGPLPSGFAPDVLPVSFFFSPRSLR